MMTDMELKAYTADDIQELDDERLEASESGKIDCTRVYIKSEADKVIAELENRIDDGDKDFEMANNQNERLLKIVRRYKYKGALDKAKRCEAELWKIRNTPLCDMNTHELWQHDDEFWQRWHNRWLELAEKFK